MIVQTAIEYLATHKRLVIPQLGALIIKEPDRTVVFSELLKRDDGVLRGLLAAKGLSPIEAAGAIDRFVFEVRHAAEHGQCHTAPGLGLFTAGPNGTIRFRHTPSAASRQAAAEQTTDAKQEPAREPRQEEPAVQPAARGEKTAPRITPDPSVKGLRYGKPIRTTNAYTYVRATKRRRPDKFLVMALIAVLIAVGAIVYGYLRERRIEQQEQIYPEQVLPATVGEHAPQPAPAAATEPDQPERP